MKRIEEFATAPDVVTVGVVHDLNLAARFADHVVVLNEARVVTEGSAAEVLTAECIRNVFGVNSTFVGRENSGMHIIFN